MGVLNRRNAFLGWLVWEVGKRFAKRKAKGAMPGGGGERSSRLPAIGAALAAGAAALWFWRRREDEDEL